jgi:hypothetical protein
VLPEFEGQKMFNTLASFYKTGRHMSEGRSAASRGLMPNKWLAADATCEIANNKPVAWAQSDHYKDQLIHCRVIETGIQNATNCPRS